VTATLPLAARKTLGSSAMTLPGGSIEMSVLELLALVAACHEIDNPLVTFEGKHGTFVWREQIEWIDLEKGYAIGTGTWKILRGTGAYAHLAGHGRVAIVDRNHHGVADRAEGLVDLGG